MAPFVWFITTLLFRLPQSSAVNSLIGKRWHDFTPKHTWVDSQQNWELIGPAPSDHRLQLRIGLKQDRFQELISNLYEVSDPTSPRQDLFILQETHFNNHI
jgi:tripeptidyl-peptidase I